MSKNTGLRLPADTSGAGIDLSQLSDRELATLEAALKRKVSQWRLLDFYADTGPLRRELYVKHMLFFGAGKKFNERCAMAANRVGKSEGMGGYELTLHLTGRYPDWWHGFKFDRAIKSWAAGDTGKTVRESLQPKLLGPLEAVGTGLIPADDIVDFTPKQGVPGAVDFVKVRSQFGGESLLVFKSYDQKRESFQGSEQDVIMLDEEPPADIVTECRLRTMPTVPGQLPGLLMLTYTPLNGVTEVVLDYLENAERLG